MATKTVLEGVRDAMYNEMVRDERVFIMGEDVGARGNVFLITQGFMDKFGKQRVIDTPLGRGLDRRRRDRRGDGGHAPDRRDPVRRLHLSRV